MQSFPRGSFLSIGFLLAGWIAPAALLPGPSPPRTSAAPLRTDYQSANQPIRLAFAGDVLLEASWKQPPLPPAELWDGVRARLAEADLVVVNLEEPLTDWPQRTRLKNARSVAAGRDYVLRATSRDAARALRDAGVRVAALANNHTMDYEEQGMRDTLARLDGAGIVSVGGGENLESAERLRTVELRGIRFGFLSFSDVVPPGYQAGEGRAGIATAKDVSRMRGIITAARPDAAVLVVIFHWGVEKARTPSPRQRELAAAAQQSGADLILGAHPHVLQGVGCMGRVPVAYSAGNFIFPTSRAAARRTAIFEITFAAGEAGAKPEVDFVRLAPALIDDRGAPQLLTGGQGNSILNEMARLSWRLGARVEGDRIRCAGSSPQPRQRRGQRK